MDIEFRKVNQLFIEKQEELIEHLKYLDIMVSTSFYSLSLSCPPVPPQYIYIHLQLNLCNNQSISASTNTYIQQSPQLQKDTLLSNAEGRRCLDLDVDVYDVEKDGVIEPLESLKRGFVDLYRDMKCLHSFCVVNYTGMMMIKIPLLIHFIFVVVRISVFRAS